MTVSERVVELLREQRRQGQDFESAWTAATAQALAETTRAETWADVLAWSRPSFRRAYLVGLPRQPIDHLEQLPVVHSGSRLVVLR